MPANSAEAAAIALGSCGIIRDGVVTRQMSAWEHGAWAEALRIARAPHLTADERLDAIARRANNAEAASFRYEAQGMAADAVDMWRVSELFDLAMGLAR